MKKLIFFALLVVVAAISWQALLKEEIKKEAMTHSKVVMVTSVGEFELELFDEQAPITVANFTKLVEEGFYNGTLFHRVIAGFMVQGGDPNTKGPDTRTYGMGGSLDPIVDEFVPGLSNVAGTLSMANSGPNTGRSQFFINVVDNTYLDGRHTVFGKVTRGMDVVLAMSKVATGEADLPLVPVSIDRVTVERP